MAPEDRRGKAATAKVRATMAGRTGGGEQGISLILAGDKTRLEKHRSGQIHIPPTNEIRWERLV